MKYLVIKTGGHEDRPEFIAHPIDADTIRYWEIMAKQARALGVGGVILKEAAWYAMDPKGVRSDPALHDMSNWSAPLWVLTDHEPARMVDREDYAESLYLHAGEGESTSVYANERGGFGVEFEGFVYGESDERFYANLDDRELHKILAALEGAPA